MEVRLRKAVRLCSADEGLDAHGEGGPGRRAPAACCRR